MRAQLLPLCVLATMSALDQDGDISGDGGVVRTARLAEGAGPRPVAGQVAVLDYTGTLADGTVFDEARGARVACGGEGNVRGLDVAARSMAVGERATFDVRHDFGYGAAGLAGRVPAHAALAYDIALVAVDDAAAADAPLALPAADGDATRLEVGGGGVSMDHLGPVVVNTDGSLSRITNWGDMTAAEQAKTQRVVAKRNEKRLRVLRDSGL